MASAGLTITVTEPGEPSREKSNGHAADGGGGDDSLAERILSAMEPKGSSKNKFLPESFIKNEITLEEIKKELGSDDCADLAKWIYEHAKRLFAIAILCSVEDAKLRKSMKAFSENNFTDKNLPLEQTLCLQNFAKDVWRAARCDSFLNRQWQLLSPVFGSEYKHEIFEQSILPFIWKDENPRVGSFGEVYRVGIHDAHREEGIPSIVALKHVRLKEEAVSDGAWDMEARAFEKIRKLNSDHIIQCFATIRQRKTNNCFFMFPWAKGNLREFWMEYQGDRDRREIAEQVIRQLLGLADALDKMHNYNAFAEPKTFLSPDPPPGRALSRTNTSFENIRHGDLKPENILRFAENEHDLGTLKIGDMGLAKLHLLPTSDRRLQSLTSYGTWRYRAPEAVTNSDQPRSRAEDIWAMGCIVLEFIIWILQGNKGLAEFNKDGIAVQGVNREIEPLPPYFEKDADGGTPGAVLSTKVRQWIETELPQDPECQRDSAIRDLLSIVKNKLLVINHQPQEATTSPNSGAANIRATAGEFRNALQEIQKKILENPEYLPISAIENSQPHSPLQPHSRLQPPQIHVHQLTTKDYTLPLIRTWEFPIENSFALKVFNELDSSKPAPQSPRSPLCDHCRRLSFYKAGLISERPLDLLDERCRLCRLWRKLRDQRKLAPRELLRINRKENESCLRMPESEDEFPILSLLMTPPNNSRLEMALQVGLPSLPSPKEPAFFSIIKLWLKDCDSSHDGCQGRTTIRLPTRLIDVGTTDDDVVHLYATTSEDRDSFEGGDPKYRYVALSHPWGDPKKHPPFCTWPSDKDDFMSSIPFEKLPQNFQNAIIATRSLEIRYLWIDSLCIIQGPDGDFNEEARHMETVFSSAYCVLAASRATGQRDGFLAERREREFVSLGEQPDDTLYVCEAIDNFKRDVVEATMNTRGWVLQERALARRTIYFTESQNYFECGEGIRCETLGKLKHYEEDFFGDPNFPEKAMEGSRALKIAYFQQLYEKYSGLEFTRFEDRPIAIKGLEYRLQRAYRTNGDYGIFGEDPNRGLFHRSLLWCRSDDEIRMEPIEFPVHRQGVPSWSWMAYKGRVHYLNPPFRTVLWEMEEIAPPWPNVGEQDQKYEGIVELRASMRTFDLGRAGAESSPPEIVYDDPDNVPTTNIRTCVIVAREKERSESDKDHYVLIIIPSEKTGPGGETMYRRIGVGKLPGRCISLDGHATKITIC